VLITRRTARGAGRCRSQADRDEALTRTPSDRDVVVLRRCESECRDASRHANICGTTPSPVQSAEGPRKPNDAEDLLFILYTSGPPGSRRAICTHGGYLDQVAYTHNTSRLKPDTGRSGDTADARLRSHGASYIVYGPIANRQRRRCSTRHARSSRSRPAGSIVREVQGDDSFTQRDRDQRNVHEWGDERSAAHYLSIGD